MSYRETCPECMARDNEPAALDAQRLILEIKRARKTREKAEAVA